MNGIKRGLQNLRAPLTVLVRQAHSNADIIENCTAVTNRNPRNLELLRIGRKPVGYYLEKPGRQYWHRLVVTKSTRYVKAEVQHFDNGPVITASTLEWAIKKQLYQATDSAAYINLGRVLAQRCLESGLSIIRSDYEPSKGSKLDLLITELQKGGMKLREMPRYKKPYPWDQYRPDKPWEVYE